LTSRTSRRSAQRARRTEPGATPGRRSWWRTRTSAPDRLRGRHEGRQARLHSIAANPWRDRVRPHRAPVVVRDRRLRLVGHETARCEARARASALGGALSAAHLGGRAVFPVACGLPRARVRSGAGTFRVSSGFGSAVPVAGWGRRRGCTTTSKDLEGERSPGRIGRHGAGNGSVALRTRLRSKASEASSGAEVGVRCVAGNGEASSADGGDGATPGGQRLR
jgi:hypothetical protein